jgi:uncharacterized protein (TIGR00255 family)
MVRSMTGYGTGSCQTDEVSVVVEARAVNHRFFDFHLRIPREFLFLEPEVQQLVRSLVRRGRVEVNVGIQTVHRGDSLVDLEATRVYETAARLREACKSTIRSSEGPSACPGGLGREIRPPAGAPETRPSAKL